MQPRCGRERPLQAGLVSEDQPFRVLFGGRGYGPLSSATMVGWGSYSRGRLGDAVLEPNGGGGGGANSDWRLRSITIVLPYSSSAGGAGGGTGSPAEAARSRSSSRNVRLAEVWVPEAGAGGRPSTASGTAFCLRYSMTATATISTKNAKQQHEDTVPRARSNSVVIGTPSGANIPAERSPFGSLRNTVLGSAQPRNPANPREAR